jgi:cytochrome c oxidase subunit 2
MNMSRPTFFSVLAMVLTASCGGVQSAVDPAGIQSQRLANLWWTFFSICLAVYLIVMVVLTSAFFRRRRADETTVPETRPDPVRENRLSNVIKAMVGVSLVALFALMITSFRAGSAINALSKAEGPLSIKVIGHQWWWEIEYKDDTNPSNNVITANEIHIPLGRPIKLELQSNDVIHSFWLPNLHGKKDLVPNYATAFYFSADKPGTFWGQCAEFCGYQHAKMRFVVTTETPEEFESWINAQRTSAAVSTGIEERGKNIFLTSVCAQCHTVQGTIANGRVGPNLSHVGSRSYIAAGSLRNTEENLRQWITDPQKIKPGIRMPMNNYSEEDLDALVAYLRSLK